MTHPLRTKKLLAIPLLALAALSRAQNLNVDGNAYYGTGPASTVGTGGGFNSGSFGPVTATATAHYDEFTGEGERIGTSQVDMSADYGSLSTTYSYAADNALYTYFSGNANVGSTDDLFLSNMDGATAGKYRLRIDLVKTGMAAVNASVSAGSFGGSDLHSSTTLISDEFNFSYDAPISANFSLFSDSNSGLYFGSFDTGSTGAGVTATLSFIITDTGGANFDTITQSSTSGAFYNVYQPRAVPEPASMAALGLGALAVLRRRRAQA